MYGCQQIKINPDSGLKAVLEFLCGESSGLRIKRGLYRSLDGTKINADCNGAANIARKVAIKLGLNLDGISSGVLISSLRTLIWS